MKFPPYGFKLAAQKVFPESQSLSFPNASIGGSTRLATLSLSKWNPEHDWTPDPFDVAQGRGEHSRTTTKTFGGDNPG
jgi:hypothetical protein